MRDSHFQLSNFPASNLERMVVSKIPEILGPNTNITGRVGGEIEDSAGRSRRSCGLRCGIPSSLVGGPWIFGIFEEVIRSRSLAEKMKGCL